MPLGMDVVLGQDYLALDKGVGVPRIGSTWPFSFLSVLEHVFGLILLLIIVIMFCCF